MVDTSLSAAVNGLLAPGAVLGQGGFTYSIPGAGSVWSYAGEPTAAGYGVLDAAQAAAFVQAIAAWDRLIAPNFTQTNDVAAPGTIRIAFTDYAQIAGAYAYAYLPQSGGPAMAADIWINAAYRTDSFDAGGNGFTALLHEIGHTLGLRHTHDTDSFPDALDSTLFSVMSYEDIVFTHWSWRAAGAAGVELVATPVSVTGPMVLDIAAAQLVYGADTTTAAGNDVYRFSDAAAFILAIYDAGGEDTIDASAAARGSVIDLEPGAYSSIGLFTVEQQIAEATAQFGAMAGQVLGQRLQQPGAYTFTDNLGIAYSTVIENAIGGRGADQISGNQAANRLEGRDGADVISGLAGDDILSGGAGDDRLDGGDGVDVAVFELSAGAASWTKNADGSWSVSAQALGVDTLVGVEVLRFTDGDVVLADAPKAALLPQAATPLDFNGDGRADILWRGAAGEVMLWNSGPRGAYVTETLWTVPNDWSIQSAADFNGDGKADLLWRSDQGHLAIWNSGPAGFEGRFLGQVPTDWRIEGAGDITGDGKADVLWRHVSGQTLVWKSAQGGFVDQGADVVPLDWTVEALADINGDGRDDVLWGHASGAMVAWTAGEAGFTGALFGIAGPQASFQAAADFSGDGEADVLWRDGTGNLTLWRSGAAGLEVVSAGALGAGWTLEEAADFNGDGRADALWRNAASGETQVWNADGSASGFAPQTLGQAPAGWEIF